MKRRLMTAVMAVALGGAMWLTPGTWAQDRSADAILEEYNAVEMPQYDASRREEENYRQEYMEQRTEALRKQADLILELYQTDPQHEQIQTLLPQRWSLLMGSLGDADTARSEAKQYLKENPDGPLTQEAHYALAQADLRSLWSIEESSEKAESVARIRKYVEKYPDDERNAGMLSSVAAYHIEDPAEARKLWAYLIEKYPDNRSAKYWPGKLRQHEGLNQPFKLEFTDAITGTEVSMEQLKDKVVVVDFWATWCGPCIAEMPHMKELYAKYKDKGVEFIGVSLDQPEENGGLEALRNYCEENEINWPQYYQGAGWSSEFSTNWGINSIPTMFIIDREGNLHSTKARGKLETMIPELLGENQAIDG